MGVDLDNCWQMSTKSYTWVEQLQGMLLYSSMGSFGSEQRSQRVAAKSDSFICTSVSGVNNNCFMQNLLSIKLLFCSWNCWEITKPSSCADVVYFSKDIYMYLLLMTYFCYQQLSPTSAWNNSYGLLFSPVLCCHSYWNSV